MDQRTIAGTRTHVTLAVSLFDHDFEIVKDPPIEWSVIAGEIVHDLRSALEHLVWQLVEATGGKPSTSNHWPVAATKQQFVRQAERRRGYLMGSVARPLSASALWSPSSRGSSESRPSVHPALALEHRQTPHRLRKRRRPSVRGRELGRPECRTVACPWAPGEAARSRTTSVLVMHVQHQRTSRRGAPR